MTTVKQLKEYLDTLPDDTEVRVLKEQNSGGFYGGTYVEEVPLDLTEFAGNFEFCDFTNNQFVKSDHPFFGKRTLTLGEN